MCKWMTLLAILGVSVLSACSGAQGSHEASPHSASLVLPVAPQPEPPSFHAAPATPTERRLSRTIEKDPDADGIADSRIIITEIFDAAGNLVDRVREEDHDADGIIDARVMTSFDE